MSAAFYETPGVLELPVSHGAPVRGSGALSAAANAGVVANVKYLLNQGAPAGGGASDGGSAIACGSSEGGHLDVVKLLTDRGASLDKQDAKDHIPGDIMETADASTGTEE